MGGDQAKVLYRVADRPMIWWVVRACLEAGVSRCVVVVGYQGASVRGALAEVPGCVFVEQTEQLGTGHATRMAEPLFPPDADGAAPGASEFAAGCDVFVLAGDGPLIRAATLKKLLEVHRARGAAATLATAVLDDPTGYGRIVRDAGGAFAGIVEQKDATEAQRALREVNPSYYCFRSGALFAALRQVGQSNRAHEYYLTDVPLILRKKGELVAVVEAVPAGDVLSINTPRELAAVDGILRERLGLARGAAAGVR
jgi:bifunctional UDP-N-acetylglucosamine pyrophosphorylase/glucosamine-1-phosphate N-acetyltransferase